MLALGRDCYLGGDYREFGVESVSFEGHLGVHGGSSDRILFSGVEFALFCVAEEFRDFTR